MTDKPVVSVIIPTLRAGEDLLECLESIASDADAPSNEVVVVFNSPKPYDLDLTKHHSGARAVETDKNLGFAGGCNLGALNAIGGKLVFLNDDMRVKPGWLASLTEPIGQDNGVVATGGRILMSDEKTIDFDGSSINLLGWGFQKGHGESARSIDDEFRESVRLPFACGGNFAIDPDVFESAGKFDETYFAYYEDVDLGWRLRLMGHEIEYVPDAVTFHNSGETGKLLAPQTKWFLQERNALMTIIKSLSDDILRKVLPIAFSLVSVRAQILSSLDETDIFPDEFWRDLILGESMKEKSEGHGGLLKGIVDGVKLSIKSGMKHARKSGLPEGYLPIESRGAAGLFAVEWCLNNWDELMSKRAKVQGMRKVDDGMLLSIFDDLTRPVLGHPREIDAMKPLEEIVDGMLGG